MRKKELLKKASALMLAGTMVFSMVGCGGSKEASNNESSEASSSAAEEKSSEVAEESSSVAEEETVTMEDTTIKIRIMNEFKNLDRILAKYEEMTKDDPIMSKIHPEFEWVAGGDYKDKLTMALNAQEDYDLMFCGGWHGYSTFAQQGNFKDLSSYFNNDKFPGLKAAFSEEFVTAMNSYIANEDGTYTTGIFNINLATAFEDARGLMYREDLRKKYNCAEITDEESLMAYIKTVTENEPDMLGMSMSNFFRMDTPFYSGKHDNVFCQDSTNVFGDQTHVYIGLSDDQKTVLNVVFPGDAQSEWDKMPEGYQYDFITEYHKERTKWNPYLSENRGSTDDTIAKDAVVTYAAFTEYESKVKTALETNPDWEFGFYVIEDAQRNKEKGAVICEMVSNNMLVVPAWSEKTDAVMYFLDWMFGTQEAHDLIQYGIQGEDWEAVGNGGYKELEVAEEDKYVMPGYSFCWNPTYIRSSEFIINDPELKAIADYIYAADTYQASPFAGFAFNPAAVETEVASVSALSNELQLNISKYDADECVEKINTWHADADAVGLEAVRAELIKQVQAFLDAKNK